jgi:hypothetical protein
MARPKAKINFKKVDEYLQAQCTGSSIASLLGIHPDTLYQAIEDKYKMGFSAYSAQKKSEGKEILKKTLWDIAVKSKNVSMGIWLSKQYLGFTDKQNINLEFERMSEDDLTFITNELINKTHEN